MISDPILDGSDRLDMGNLPDHDEIDKWLRSDAGTDVQFAVEFVERRAGSEDWQSTLLRNLVEHVQKALHPAKSTNPPTHFRTFLLYDDHSPRPMRDKLYQVYTNESQSLPRFLVASCSDPTNDGPLLKYTKTLDPVEQARQLDEGFKVTYKGRALDRFLRHLAICAKLYKDTVHYGKVIAILQASTSGKSRLVKQLSTVKHLVSLCFRLSDEPSAGWPPGDLTAMLYFQHTDNYYGEELVAAFLGALAAVITEHADTSSPRPFDMWSYDLRSESGDDGPLLRTRLIGEVVRRAAAKLQDEATREWLEQARLRVPQSIPKEDIAIDPSKRFPEITSVPPVPMRQPEAPKTSSDMDTDISPSNSAESYISRASESQAPAADGSDAEKNSTEWHIDLFKYFCKADFERLSELVVGLEPAKPTQDLQFFIAFDECAQLQIDRSTSLSPSKAMSVIALMRILKAADILQTPVKFWHLFLDTNSEAFLLAPSGPKAASARLRGPYDVLPPFVHLGFNQMVTNSEVKLADQVLTLHFLQQWGRPYWATVTRGSVVVYAQEKLFHRKGDHATFVPTNKDHVFAAFSYRVALEIGSGAAASRLETRAVSRHMRVLRSIAGDKMETLAPSEPVLAIAAADALNSSLVAYQDSIRILLNELVLKDAILDRGGQGELCNRLLFILARDRAVTQGLVKTFLNAEKTHVTPITLAEFLRTLLGPSYGCKEDENVFALRRWANDRWVNWTHWVPLTKIITEIPIRMLEIAFFTGAIFQCHHDQAVIDWFAVVYNGRLDQKFNRKCLEIVGGQTKAKPIAASQDIGEGLTLPPIVTSGDDGKDVRKKATSLVILMDLATNQHFESSSGPMIKLTKRAAKSPFQPKNSEDAEQPAPSDAERKKYWAGYAGWDPNDDPEPSCFFLNIRGRSANQYRVLEDLGVGAYFERLFQKYLSHSLSAEFRGVEEGTMEEMLYHEYSIHGPVAASDDEGDMDKGDITDGVMDDGDDALGQGSKPRARRAPTQETTPRKAHKASKVTTATQKRDVVPPSQ